MSIKRCCIDDDLHERRFQTNRQLCCSSWRVQHRAGTNPCHFTAGFPSSPPRGAWDCDLINCSHVLFESQSYARCEVPKGAITAGEFSFQSHSQPQPFTRHRLGKMKARDHSVHRQVPGPRTCWPGLKGLHAPWECLIAAQHARPDRATLDIRT